MVGTDGLKVWVSTLIEYDAYGNAKVLASFTKIAKTSDIKGIERKKKFNKPQAQDEAESENLF